MDGPTAPFEGTALDTPALNESRRDGEIFELFNDRLASKPPCRHDDIMERPAGQPLRHNRTFRLLIRRIES